jgi:hypothetical protein
VKWSRADEVLAELRKLLEQLVAAPVDEVRAD